MWRLKGRPRDFPCWQARGRYVPVLKYTRICPRSSKLSSKSQSLLFSTSAHLSLKQHIMAEFIGSIDQGTTSSRFLIFNKNGEPVASHQEVCYQQLIPKLEQVKLTIDRNSLKSTLNLDGTNMILRKSSLPYTAVSRAQWKLSRRTATQSTASRPLASQTVRYTISLTL